MKLLCITPYYAPSWFYGGPPKCIAELAEAVAALGSFSTEVVTLNANGPAKLFDTDEPVVRNVNGVTVHYLPRSESLKGKMYFSSPLLHRYLDQFSDAGCVHVNTLFNDFSKSGMQFALRCKIPYLVTVHGMLGAYSLRHSKWIKRIHRLLYDDALLHHAFAVHFTAENEKNDAVLNKQIKPVVIPLGIQFQQPDPLPKAFRENGNLRMIFIGRLHPIKGIDLLIRAMAGMPAEMKEKTSLDIFGADETKLASSLLKLAEEGGISSRVRYCGVLKPEQRTATLRQYDLLALTSHHENFGLVVAEALADGLPVFISDQVSLADFVSQNDCGWISSLQPESLTRALNEIYRSPARLFEMKSARGSEAVRSEFDMQKVALQFESLYRQAAASKNLPG